MLAEGTGPPGVPRPPSLSDMGQHTALDIGLHDVTASAVRITSSTRILPTTFAGALNRALPVFAAVLAIKAEEGSEALASPSLTLMETQTRSRLCRCHISVQSRRATRKSHTRARPHQLPLNALRALDVGYWNAGPFPAVTDNCQGLAVCTIETGAEGGS